MTYNKPAEILLVDNTDDGVGIVREALKAQKRSARLHVAENSKDALDYLFKRGDHTDASRPDLVLLELPGRNGRDVLAEAKANFALCDIPIIVFTGGATPADIIDAWGLHANCYIDKPKEHEDYASMLQSVLGFWLSVARLPTMH